MLFDAALASSDSSERMFKLTSRSKFYHEAASRLFFTIDAKASVRPVEKCRRRCEKSTTPFRRGRL
jgi:hypothetical protein